MLTFFKGFPSREMLEEIFNNGDKESNHCLVIDDYGLEASSSKEALDIFLVHTHHFRFTTLYLNQTMYGGGKYARAIALNMNYLIVFAIPLFGTKNIKKANKILINFISPPNY